MDLIAPRQPSPLERDPARPVSVPAQPEPVDDDIEFEPTIVRGRE